MVLMGRLFPMATMKIHLAVQLPPDSTPMCKATLLTLPDIGSFTGRPHSAPTTIWTPLPAPPYSLESLPPSSTPEKLATLPAIVGVVHGHWHTVPYQKCQGLFLLLYYCTMPYQKCQGHWHSGSASLFLSIKMSSFLANSKEAEARNTCTFTRTKGLCDLLLPSTHEYTSSSLHSLRTLCP